MQRFARIWREIDEAKQAYTNQLEWDGSPGEIAYLPFNLAEQAFEQWPDLEVLFNDSLSCDYWVSRSTVSGHALRVWQVDCLMFMRELRYKICATGLIWGLAKVKQGDRLDFDCFFGIRRLVQNLASWNASRDTINSMLGNDEFAKLIALAKYLQ